MSRNKLRMHFVGEEAIKDLHEFGWFPIEWIVTHFTDLTPDELEELREMQMLITNELID